MSDAQLWSVEELASRWQRTRAEMAKAGLDCVIAGESSNFRYFTGYESTQFLHRMRPMLFLLPQNGRPALYVYNTEGAKLKHLAGALDIRGYVDVPFPVDELASLIDELGWGSARIGVELGPNQRMGLPVEDYQSLRKAVPGASWVDGGPALMAAQTVKTPGEIETLRHACEISQRSWLALLSRLHPGVTGEEIYRQLAIANIELGADPYQPVSAHVTRLSLSANHDDVFRAGDMLKLDFHSRYRGYWSDLCRLASIGEPTADHVAWHGQMYQTLMDCVSLLRPGNEAKVVAARSNEMLRSIGQPLLTGTKRIGHGVGLEATTPPSLNVVDDTVFAPGMTIAVEPRFTAPIGPMLLEETVLVTESGPELLSHGAEDLGAIT